MKLGELLSPWIPEIKDERIVHGLAVDHRLVNAGYVFLAYQGKGFNGADFIAGAIANGAIAIISDKPINDSKLSLPVYLDVDLQCHIGEIAARFYQAPTEQLIITGITGTNGKTTVAYLLMQAYDLLGEKSSYIGTLGMGDMQSMQETGLTTPGPIQIQQHCAQLLKKGVEHVAVEVSSHALDQGRVTGVAFEQAIFTNMTHDHLDYHGTFEKYVEAKSLLFQCPTLKSIIVNADDAHYKKMLTHANPYATLYRYGVKSSADIHVQSMRWTLTGMFLEISSPWGNISLQSSLLGDFNVYNILAVFTALMAQGFELNAVADVIGRLQAAPGRMQVVATTPLVIVDYAHTPDALQKALQTLRKFKKQTQAGKLWVVFGCGGDRDIFKRPMMGKIAMTEADRVVVTSDNPRTEEPESIIQQILAEIPENAEPMMAIVDRKLAIITCLEKAHNNDIILIAGKGHENYQLIGTEKQFFSDQSVVNEYFSEAPIQK